MADHKKPLFVVISIFDRATGELCKEHEANYNRSHTREWIERLMIWALFHNMSVEIQAKEGAT